MKDRLNYCENCKLLKYQCQCSLNGTWFADCKEIKTNLTPTPPYVALQTLCVRCEQPWIGHNCPIKGDEANPEQCDHNFVFGVFKPRPLETPGKGIYPPKEDVLALCSWCGECRLKEIK